MSFFQQYLEPNQTQVQQNSQISLQTPQFPQNPQMQSNPNNQNNQVTVSQKEKPKFEDYVKKYIEVENETSTRSFQIQGSRAAHSSGCHGAGGDVNTAWYAHAWADGDTTWNAFA